MKKWQILSIVILIILFISLGLDIKSGKMSKSNLLGNKSNIEGQEEIDLAEDILSDKDNIINIGNNKVDSDSKNLIDWNNPLTLIEANSTNTILVGEITNACYRIGLNNVCVYNENTFSYPTENKIVYISDTSDIDGFDEVVYTYKNINNEKYYYKLITKYLFDADEFDKNNKFDFSNMPQNEFFSVLTGINKRDVTEINDKINKFLEKNTSIYNRLEIVNNYNGLEETIVVRLGTIYYYLKTGNIKFASE